MNKSKPVFDLVICTAGRFDMLEKCLDSIYRTATHPVTITIIDDGCIKEDKRHYNYLFVYNPDKDVHKMVVSYTSKRNEIPAGFIKSSNMGAKGARGQSLIFINDDIEIHDGYFDAIYKRMQNPLYGVVGAKLLFPPTSSNKQRPAGKVQHIGVALDIRAGVVHPLSGWSADNPKACVSRECLAVTGALLAIRSSLFRELGGFDTVYGMGYYDDVDLCLKVRQKGYRIYIDTDATAYHYTGASAEKGMTIMAKGFQQNTMIFKAKWANSGLLIFDSWTYG